MINEGDCPSSGALVPQAVHAYFECTVEHIKPKNDPKERAGRPTGLHAVWRAQGVLKSICPSVTEDTLCIGFISYLSACLYQRVVSLPRSVFGYRVKISFACLLDMS